MAIMAVRRGNRALPDAEAMDPAERYIAVNAMSFENGELENVAVQIGLQFAAIVGRQSRPKCTRNNLVRDQATDPYLLMFVRHHKISCRNDFEFHRAEANRNHRLARGKKIACDQLTIFDHTMYGTSLEITQQNNIG